MMYRIRFALIMMTILFKKPGEIMDEYSLSFRAIPFLDTDFKRFFTQSYAALTALGRWHYVFNSKFRSAAIQKKWIPITSAETFTFRKPIFWFDKVTLKTQILCWNEKCFFVKQTFLVKNEIRAFAYSEGSVRTLKGYISPQQAFSDLGSAVQSPQIPSDIQAWYSMRDKK